MQTINATKHFYTINKKNTIVYRLCLLLKIEASILHVKVLELWLKCEQKKKRITVLLMSEINELRIR